MGEFYFQGFFCPVAYVINKIVSSRSHEPQTFQKIQENSPLCKWRIIREDDRESRARILVLAFSRDSDSQSDRMALF